MPSFSILISGAGSIGKRHARNLRALGIENIAVADPSAEQREAIAEELHCAAFTDFEEALNDVILRRAQDDIPIVFICSPTKCHIEQALKAAQIGAHLFIEKPLSHSLNGIEELKRTIGARNLICMVACNMRFHHGPATVKKLLDEGKIGTPTEARIYTGSYLPDWRPSTARHSRVPCQNYKQSYSADPAQGGAILDCIHELDLALWFFGPATLENVSKEPAAELGIEVEGTADLALRHESGCKSSVHMSFMEREYKRFCNIEGSKRSIVWDINRKTVELLARNGTVIESYPEPEGYGTNQMYIDEVTHFLDCVEHKQKPQGSLAEATEALTIALAARGRGTRMS